MASVTQCPACGTRFRVVPDQLKISQGWVRCGKCSEVFDARVAMDAPADLPASPSNLKPSVPAPSQVSIVLRQESRDVPAQPELASPDVPPQEPDASQAAVESEPAAASFEPDVPRFLLSVAQEPPAAIDPVEAVPAQAEPEVLVDEPPAEDAMPKDDTARTDVPEEPPGTSVDPEPDSPADVDVDDSPSVVSAAELDASHIGFVRQARRQAFWQRRSVVAGLSVVGLLLAFALTVQVALDRRDWLAAAVPAWRPLLEEVCRPLGCEVTPWQHIESVSLDSSTLVREREGVYRLEVGLKNQADVAVAMPAVELSLTNAQDEVVVRRVLLPGEWPEPVETLPPQSTTLFSLRMALRGVRSDGYRAVVFYP